MRRLVIVLAALCLTACASVQRLSAANDVHVLLLSIRDNDQAAFEAHVDRPALQRQIQGLIEARVDKRYGDIAAALSPGLAQLAGDTLVQPSVFKYVARQYGYSDDTPIPGPVAIAGALKPMPDGRVCAITKKNGDCKLIFTKEAGVWKLTGFQGSAKDLHLKL
jgi:hypothetical protein